ncbi:MAG: hypothetical protein JOZ25_03705 [Actinobacteria bacterium]|nr:hypothetical protein [Actinomycetota bacterium]
MRRLAIAAIVGAVVALAAGALTALAAVDGRRLAFAGAANPFGRGAWVGLGTVACQKHIHVEAPFDEIVMQLVAFPPEPRISVTVRSAADGRALARGDVPRGVAGGWQHVATPTVSLSRGIPAGRIVDVCIRSVGRLPVGLFGSPHVTAGSSHAAVISPHGVERATGTDIRLVFARRRTRSVLSMVPAMVRRAALFKPGFIGAWTYWVLLAALLVAVPALLVRALWSADRGPLAERGRPSPAPGPPPPAR